MGQTGQSRAQLLEAKAQHKRSLTELGLEHIAPANEEKLLQCLKKGIGKRMVCLVCVRCVNLGVGKSMVCLVRVS